MNTSRRSLFVILFSILALNSVFLEGCLKTRAQLSNNGSADEKTPEEIDARQPVSGRKSATTSYEVEDMKNEIMRLTGKVEEIDHIQKTNNAADVRESISSLENRIVELEKNQVLIMTELKEVKDRSVTTVAPTTSQADTSSQQSARALIIEGYKLLDGNAATDAADKFKLALTKKPKNSETADARFGMGEAEYQQKNYKKAIVEYSKVQEAFSKSPRIPASLYKIGLSFEKLNMTKESKDFYTELQERYPKSAEAKKARAKLKTK